MSNILATAVELIIAAIADGDDETADAIAGMSTDELAELLEDDETTSVAVDGAS